MINAMEQMKNACEPNNCDDCPFYEMCCVLQLEGFKIPNEWEATK